MKICSKCKIKKEFTEFHISNRTKCGYKSQCKECRKSERPKKTRPDYSEEMPCYKCNVIKTLTDYPKDKQRKNGYRRICKACCKLLRIENREQYKVYQKKRFQELKKDEEFFSKYRDKRYKETQDWRLRNKEHLNKYKIQYNLKNPHAQRYGKVLHTLLAKKNLVKKAKSEILLGYSLLQFKEKFPILPKGMHIDHKIPISWFKEDAPIDIVNHLENLQLLESRKNIAKLNRYSDSVNKEFYALAKEWVKEEYLDKLKIE